VAHVTPDASRRTWAVEAHRGERDAAGSIGGQGAHGEGA
jgi:hypothetical protein